MVIPEWGIMPPSRYACKPVYGELPWPWRGLCCIQARFVDAPAAAVSEAERLVVELMQAMGYPMGDFEQRAADISVDHPHVIEHYRRRPRHRAGE